MISYLKVRNLAIVEQLEIEPGSGLNVLTGETGAGKSLLIDSLEFLSGARGSTDSIRTGEEKLLAEAVFHVPMNSVRDAAGLGIELEPTGGDEAEIIVRRELASNGRGRVQVNGAAIPVRDLVTVTDRLLEIHGQSTSHDRIAGQSFRELLDSFADLRGLVDETRGAHVLWHEAAEELRRLEEAHRDRSLKLDLLKYQIDEISAAKLEGGEEETLRGERAVLSNAREISESTAGAYELLEGGDESATSQIARAVQLLASLARDIDEIRGVHDQLEEIRYRLEDPARTMAEMAENVRHDPERLEWIEERLVTIERLKKKYGSTVGEVLEHLARSRAEYEELGDYESSLERIAVREREAFERWAGLARQLSGRRAAAAGRLENGIQRELTDLAMEGTTVSIHLFVSRQEGSRLQIAGEPVAFGPEGFDRVEILIAPNPGEEPRPIQRIASGGELSRIQLAIAAAIFKSSNQSSGATLVFDEIDAGIGGRVAEVVGRKLCELAAGNQVICVTHLPQIASLGTTHFRVWKESESSRTLVRIECLRSRDERIAEIARMLGGEAISESATAHAAALLDRADRPPRKRSGARSVSSV